MHNIKRIIVQCVDEFLLNGGIKKPPCEFESERDYFLLTIRREVGVETRIFASPEAAEHAAKQAFLLKAHNPVVATEIRPL